MMLLLLPSLLIAAPPASCEYTLATCQAYVKSMEAEGIALVDEAMLYKKQRDESNTMASRSISMGVSPIWLVVAGLAGAAVGVGVARGVLR